MAAAANSPSSTLIAINITAQTPIKLSSNNYCAGRMQSRPCFLVTNSLAMWMAFIHDLQHCPPGPPLLTPMPILTGSDKISCCSMPLLTLYLCNSCPSTWLHPPPNKHGISYLLLMLNRHVDVSCNFDMLSISCRNEPRPSLSRCSRSKHLKMNSSSSKPPTILTILHLKFSMALGMNITVLLMQ